MARYSKKSQYKQVEDRVIYVLHAPFGNQFYVSHCRKDLLRDVYKHHLRYQYYKTESFISSCKEQFVRPCLHVLEKVSCTKVDAYHHVIAWAKILCDNGWHSLDQGNIACYMEDMLEDTLSVYAQHKGAVLEDLLRCQHCVVRIYSRKSCPHVKEEKHE